MSSAFVGFDPDQVEQLVAQLRGAAEDLGAMARQADQALDRVATLIPVHQLECDIGRLRGCGITIGEMSGDVQARLTKFLADQQLEAAGRWGERALGGGSEAVEDALKSARRWQPGHWAGGEWIPGRLIVEERWARFVGDGVVVDAHALRATRIPGRFGPSSWVEGGWVDDLAKQKAGKILGRGMNALDVGLAGWGEWSARSDLTGAERLAHAGWAGLTVGGFSAAGGSVGYGLGFAAAIALGASPLGPAVVVAGIGGAILGSEVGQHAGRIVKDRGKAAGRAVVSAGKGAVKGIGKGARKVLGLFS